MDLLEGIVVRSTGSWCTVMSPGGMMTFQDHGNSLNQSAGGW